MDRVLELTDPILFSLEADSDMVRDLAGNDDIWPFLLQQLSSSAWAYILGSSICIVTRTFVAFARIQYNTANESELILTRFDRTTAQDVTSAFRDGYKIIATWTVNEKTGISSPGSSAGASQLWTLLGGEEPGKMADSSPSTKPETPSNNTSSPIWEDKPGDQNTTEPEGPILPQNEIDKLIAALRNKDAMGDNTIEHPPFSSGPEVAVESSVQTQEIGAPPQQTVSEWREETTRIPNTSSVLSPGVSLEEWTETPISSNKELPVESDEPISSLGNLSAGQPYSIFIFERRDDFDRELENSREISSGTILAFWGNTPIFVRLGAHLYQNLENYRTKYRAAAAALESSITRLRQQEQMLPNLQNYHNQQGTLTSEAEKLSLEMHTMRMKQVLMTHEGRFLARKVFSIEATRQSLLRDLTRLSHSILRRPNPSFFTRSRFIGRRQKYLTVQRQLESSFNKLANLEREVQRRLEYQADWQSLISRKFKIQREQDEIGRFIRATASLPGGPSADLESLNRWLKTEWEGIKRRERLLRAWQECLTDEKAWSVRTIDEPVMVLADGSLLTLPGVARGALVVAMALNHTTIMAVTPEECAGWVMVDPGLRIVGSGKGPGFNEEPFLATVADLAKEVELNLQEAFQSLGFEDRIKQGME